MNGAHYKTILFSFFTAAHYAISFRGCSPQLSALKIVMRNHFKTLCCINISPYRPSPFASEEHYDVWFDSMSSFVDFAVFSSARCFNIGLRIYLLNLGKYLHIVMTNSMLSVIMSKSFASKFSVFSICNNPEFISCLRFSTTVYEGIVALETTLIAANRSFLFLGWEFLNCFHKQDSNFMYRLSWTENLY